MSETLRALAALGAFARRPMPLAKGAAATREALGRLGERRDEAPPSPPEDELERLDRRLRSLFATGRGGEATRRELARAPWIFWKQSAPRAVAIPGLVQAVLAQARSHRRTLRTLAHCWVLTCDRESRSHAELGTELDRLGRASDDPRLVWAKLGAEELDLFDPVRGINHLANRLLTGSERLETVLDRYGLADPMRAVSGLLRGTLAVGLQGWKELARRRDARSILERLLALATQDGKLRFREARASLATGLLAPWSAGPPPAEEIRARVQRFLLDQLGDPRVRPQNWTDVEPEALRLFKSWLARASLEAFFTIIRDFALDHQWRYREAFWKACLNRNAIDDVWLALAPDVRRAAKVVGDLRGAFSTLWGGVDPKHAVILMRIGDLVLCEWSHNGKLRAWPRDWKQAPQLGRSQYTGSELKTPSLVFPESGPEHGLRHHGSNTGRWQDKAARLLRERVGLDLSNKDYMPR